MQEHAEDLDDKCIFALAVTMEATLKEIAQKLEARIGATK